MKKLIIVSLASAFLSSWLCAQIYTEGYVSQTISDTPTFSSGGLYVGGHGGPGALVVGAGGSATFSGSQLQIGGTPYAGLGGDGTITVSGGQLYSYDRALFGIASSSGYTGVTGSLYLNSGTVSLTTVSLGQSQDYTGVVNVSGGTLTVSQSLVVGGSGDGRFVMSGGTAVLQNLTISNADGPGVGHVTVSGGSLTITGGLSTGGSNSRGGSLTVKGGSFDYGATFAHTAGSLNLSSRADEIRIGTLSMYGTASLTLEVAGGKEISGPIVQLQNWDTATSTEFKLDLSEYSATQDKILDLATVASYVSDDVLNHNWVIEGLNEGSYEIVGGSPYWDDQTLKVAINYIPEPSAAAGLLGALVLALAARRRR